MRPEIVVYQMLMDMLTFKRQRYPNNIRPIAREILDFFRKFVDCPKRPFTNEESLIAEVTKACENWVAHINRTYEFAEFDVDDAFTL